ncbi:tape measure protein [Hymenobacter sp. YC55]|uniref:tape measure protein n=1 Tax=Hymenobacter sp. YC55 TaxID=3034019 RepID=UPI0023F67956|nr:tape measure protein [Hymenobacter sp. YC55]MDF7809910.1 tape measure protein [Hymenobacter sp. YC55]
MASLADKVSKFGSDVEKPHKVKVDTSQAQSGLSGLASMAGRAFAAVGIFEAAKGIVKMGSDLEQTRVQFETFTGSAEAGNKVIADLQKFAQITPFDDEQVISGGRQLLAFGEKAESLNPILTKLGNISSATGKDFGELISMYGKNKLSGIIQGEDLNQLVDAGIPVMDSLAKQLGVTTAEVRKMGADGKISFGMLDKAFDELGGAGGKWGNLMEKQSKTFAGRLSSLVGFAQNIGGKMGEALTPGLGKIVDAGGTLLTFISTKSTQIIAMFRPLQDALQPLIDAFDGIYVQLGITGDGAGFLTTVFNGMATAITYLSPVIKVAASALGAIYTKFAGLLGAIVRFVETSPRLQKFFAGLLSGATAAFSGIASAAVKAFGGLADILEGVFTMNWGKLKTGLKNTLMAVADGGGIAEQAGKGFADGYKKGFKKSTLFDQAKEPAAGTDAASAFMAGNKKGAAAPASLAPSLKEKAGSAGAAGGSKVTNITLNIRELIGVASMQVASAAEGAENVAQQVMKMIVAELNDVNTIAST